MTWFYARILGFVVPPLVAGMLGGLLNLLLPSELISTVLQVAVAAIWMDQLRRLIAGPPARPKAGFSAPSPRTERLDTFEDRDDPQIAGPSNDVYDLTPPAPPRVGMSQIAEQQPELSLIDACAQLRDLYLGALASRPDGLARFEPYLSDAALERLMQGTEGLDGAEVVAAGPTNVLEAGCDDSWAWLLLETRALVEERRGESRRVFQERDQMRVVRRLDAPDGAPWTVQSFPDSQRTPLTRPPADPGRSPERGNSLESVIAPDLGLRRSAFDKAHPGHSWPSLEGWLAEAFVAYAAACAGKPDEGDQLGEATADMVSYEAQGLKRLGLRRCVEDPVFHSAELVRMDQEPHYDLATFRVRGAWREWLEEESGELWRGDPSQVRFFSEYWTLIRPRDPRKLGELQPGRQGWTLRTVVNDEDYHG